MKLETVRIKRFRSIIDAQLDNCGNLNVLIGKNNSGKSNILSAIYTFFACIRGGSLVTLDPRIGQVIDFNQRDINLPIEFNLAFSMSLAERDALVRNIVTEAPQMRNAVDGIDPSLRLSVTLNITPPPTRYGVVSRIDLIDSSKRRDDQSKPVLTLLNVSDEAAAELHKNLSNSAQQSADEATLRHMGQDFELDDWRMSKDREVRALSPRAFSRRYLEPGTSPELANTIETLLRDMASYDEFKRALESVATRVGEEAANIRQAPLTNKIVTFSGEEAAVPKYVQSILRNVSALKVHQLSELRTPIGKREAQQLLSLKVRRGGTAAFRNIQETVSALLGVQIDAFENDSPSTSGGANAEMDIDDFLAEVNGAGIRESLRLVLDVEFERPNVLLVEEPEVHLHPALETTMMRFLKQISLDCQVFITTHSTNFLDTADMKNVYLVSKSKSTQVQLIDLEDAETTIPKELGIRLSSLFMYDRLVFVEGPSDEGIIREWAAKLGVNLSQANVGFVHMGGVRHLSYFATEATLSFLTKRQVHMWFLIDRDERDSAEIARIEHKLKDKAVVHVLAKREIENYLVCPSAIVKLICQKKMVSALTAVDDISELTETAVKTAIVESADALKEVTIAKRVAKEICQPIYPSLHWTTEPGDEASILSKVVEEGENMIKNLQKVISDAEGIYQQQSADVNASWSSTRTSLVPGDLLLDKVFSRFGLRFHKDRDGVQLASLMSEFQIDEEMRTIIHAFVC